MKGTRRNNRAAVRLLCAAATLALLLGVVGCGKDDEDWLNVQPDTLPTISGEDSLSSDSAARFEGEYPAPAFRSGSYRLVSSTVKLTEYSDDTGAVVYTYTDNTRYTYDLAITAGDGLQCAYTFKNICVSNSTDDGEGVLLDTSDPDSYKDDNTAGYFDLVGRTFTVAIDGSGNVTGVSGVDEIVAAYPSTTSLLDKDSLAVMASDLFYPMPATYASGTSWQRTQYDSVNTYTVARLTRGLFGVSVAGAAAEPYSYTDDSSGSPVTVNCTSISPLTGQLWIDQNDRAIQELSTYQRSVGTTFYDDYDTTYGYSYTVNSTSTITAG